MTDAELSHALVVMEQVWAPGTRETYGAGLLAFHAFCDRRQVPERLRCPAGTGLLLVFLTACAGSYAGSSLANFLFAVKAWHTLHMSTLTMVPWTVRMVELSAALDGAARLAPPSSRREKRSPFTTAILDGIISALDPTSALDIAVKAALVTTFWTMARTGEFVTPDLQSKDPARFISRGGLSQRRDRNNLPVLVFSLPSIKTSPSGEDVYCSHQHGPSGPYVALVAHFRLNNPPLHTPLFAWHHPHGLRPLMHSAFTKCVDTALTVAGLPKMQYHGLQISSIPEYLLRGLPLDVVKTMGRWSSNSFSIYLRRHAVVLAPYIQAAPVLELFTRVTMPPPC
ncbi:hypothetical protein M422DRAFT_170578 [Sphaerobolus stellatus SS14]|uniref:Uncharacterized protein n=1 Tax=Sphaerobolus stellatus (strain SS14) TaxID=990650 RepID=A0A0C9VWW7_SPHS4|nr:hypothetical protein M422DRAFT_170578 [Sphaerobolus stellatus SS14]